MRLAVDIPKGLWLTSNRHITNRPYRSRIVRDLHMLAKHASAGRVRGYNRNGARGASNTNSRLTHSLASPRRG